MLRNSDPQELPNSCIIPIILYYSPAIFPSLMRKAFIILSRVSKCMGKTACIPHGELARFLTSKHFSACISFADQMLQDQLHTLHKDLNAHVCGRENGRLPFRSITARTEAFRNSPCPSLIRFINSPAAALMQEFYNKHIYFVIFMYLFSRTEHFFSNKVISLCLKNSYMVTCDVEITLPRQRSRHT